MPIVNIDELEKQAEKDVKEESSIVTKIIGDKTVFKGKYLNGWFDSYDECHQENQKKRVMDDNKLLGLNEQGQTPEQVENAKKRADINKQLAEKQKELVDLAVKLQKIQPDNEEKSKKKGK